MNETNININNISESCNGDIYNILEDDDSWD